MNLFDRSVEASRVRGWQAVPHFVVQTEHYLETFLTLYKHRHSQRVRVSTIYDRCSRVSGEIGVLKSTK